MKISFEFSPKLGVRELPRISPNHESNVKGLYVVGDLADAPIIKVALNQGFDVARSVAEDLRPAGDEAILDVVVVGAGPAGIGAALALRETGLRYVVIEQCRPFDTIQNFPKNKRIFSEPRAIESKGGFWFEDAAKEELVKRWREAIEERSLNLHQPEEVTDIQRLASGPFEVRTLVASGGLDLRSTPGEGVLESREGESKSYLARRVVLAIGRRGKVRRLGIAGEDLEKVSFSLRDPADYRGRELLVVGGGDSAVEAAVSCADAGARVTVSYRGDRFTRAKPENRRTIEEYAAEGRVRTLFGTSPKLIEEAEVVLDGHEGELRLPNDDVLVFIGTALPRAFLNRIGIRMSGDIDLARALWIACFGLITYCFYTLKAKKMFFPFGPEDALGFVPGLLEADLGFRSVDASFWGTVVYSIVLLLFGIRAYRRYPSRTQKRRYISLVSFQWVFLFGIPEILAPMIIERPWKIYAAVVPWPLSIWSLIDAPSWAGGDTATALAWIAVGFASAFVVIPLYVRYQGERFCSYLCGCGGLAETLGDFWRHLAPRGSSSYRTESFGRAILLLALPVTALILADAWGILSDGLYSTKEFAQYWYSLMIDFVLASIVGVAFYPYWGSRVWCRFFCPLRAWMQILAARIARLKIESNDRCIGCGECTRFCQMGIDVQRFAQRREPLRNTDSSCIQCGICIEVCPMEVLQLTGPRSAHSTG